MKNIIKVVVLIVAMMASNANLYAQKVEQQRITREQLAETQARSSPMKWRWMMKQPGSL